MQGLGGRNRKNNPREKESGLHGRPAVPARGTLGAFNRTAQSAGRAGVANYQVWQQSGMEEGTPAGKKKGRWYQQRPRLKRLEDQMSTKTSIAPQKDTKRQEQAPNPFFLIDKDVRKGFGHMLGMLWLRELEARKAQVA